MIIHYNRASSPVQDRIFSIKFLKKRIKLIGFIILIALGSIGIGINAAILPVFRRQDIKETKIEMIETKDDESDDQENEQKG